MRDFELPGRSEAFATNGMIAASHPQAALAGLDVLKAGGNAVDAAITAAAMLAVVEPSQTGIGGDCFVLLKRRNGPVLALEGAGWAPAAVEASRLHEQGRTTIDPGSPNAVTVPGAIRAWHRLAMDHGSFDWARLLQPAVAAARDGAAVTERLARDWARAADRLRADPDTRSVFLPGGEPPAPGDLHRQTALAGALEAIAAQGPDVFYEGWIAADIVGKLRGLGGVLTADDMALWQPRYVTPISTRYRGHEIWECPPSGQGVIALAMAAMLDHFDLGALGSLSSERFHLQAEAARLAYAERDDFLAEGAHSLVAHLLSPDRVRERVARISASARMAHARPARAPAHRDTVYLTVVDRDGTAVSFINSIFDDFGSAITAPASGILLHNRGCGFVTDPGHPNTIAGRKRPMHTIIPALLTRDAEAVMSFGVTGAHFQPLGQIQILTNILDYGMTVQAALDHPRMYAHGDVLHLERTVPAAVAEGLRALGHNPEPAPNPLGTGQAIWIDRARGLLRGGADHRRDGIAIGH